MARRGMWVLTNPKEKAETLSEKEKNEISEKCQPLVEEFKKHFIDPNPNKEYNYTADIYTSWYRNYFYFCETFKSEHPNRTADEFKEKFVRLTYKRADCFDFAYFRHTGKWFEVANNLTLNDCLEMMKENPNFQPI